MQGLHLTADLSACPVQRRAMTEPEALRDLCLTAVRAAGLTAVGELVHRFTAAPGAEAGEPAGITGVVLLAESHLALHTWPEKGAVTLDVFVCNLGTDNRERAQALMTALQSMFGAAAAEHHRIERGAA